MKVLDIDIFTWIRENIGNCRYNFVGSGFDEPFLENFGINLSYEDYRKEAKEVTAIFNGTVAEI
jgi:hypothetical protein